MTSEGDLLEGVDELVLRHLCRAMKSPELRDEDGFRIHWNPDLPK